MVYINSTINLFSQIRECVVCLGFHSAYVCIVKQKQRSANELVTWKIENIACSSKSPFLSKFMEGDLLHKALLLDY